jgi:hypothetical protein
VEIGPPYELAARATRLAATSRRRLQCPYGYAVPAAAARSREIARSELAIAWIATGLIALHVLDDNFLQPEPGTSAGDHLVSGLVPLAVLLGLAFVYPGFAQERAPRSRSPSGSSESRSARARRSYYTIKVGASRDDYTGFLALGAGVALVGLGVVTLWRSRRTDDRLARRYGRRVLLTFAGLIVFVVLVMPVAVSYVFTHATFRVSLLYEGSSRRSTNSCIFLVEAEENNCIFLVEAG